MELLAWPVALLCAVALALFVWARERARRRCAERTAISLRQAQESTLRLLRLSTGDQRNLALTLIGHAEALQPADESLTGLARRLLEISDSLVEHTETPDGPRFLSDEALDLQAAVEFAAAQVMAHLGPSRRAWRVDPAFGGITAARRQARAQPGARERSDRGGGGDAGWRLDRAFDETRSGRAVHRGAG